MRRKTIALLLTSIFAAVFTVCGVEAQLYTPFVEPGEFNPDFQYFARHDGEWASFDHGTKPPPTGTFFTYDRLYLWVSRPDNDSRIDRDRGEFSESRMDRGLGHRVEAGYMTDDDHGWLFSWSFLNGPLATDQFKLTRLNILNEDDVLGRPVLPTDDDMMMGGGMMDMNTTDDLDFPISDRNNHEYDLIFPATEPLGRDYIMRDTLNDATFTSYEVSKSFRFDRYHHGGWGELYLGARYIVFNDITVKDSYIFGEAQPLSPLGDTDDVFESRTTLASGISNKMIGPQIGLRYYRNRERWKLSSDIRFAALQNFQEGAIQVIEETTQYADFGEGEEPTAYGLSKAERQFSNSEFVYGIDVRAEAAYELTRDFSFRFGLHYMHFAQGVWRGNNVNHQSQDLMLIGATVGAVLNR